MFGGDGATFNTDGGVCTAEGGLLMGRDDLLVFTHIGYTGGGTLGHLIDAHFWEHEILRADLEVDLKPLYSRQSEWRAARDERLLRRYHASRRPIRVIEGHHYVGWDQRLRWGHPNPRYFVLMRDPVKRFISNRRYRDTSLERLKAVPLVDEIDQDLAYQPIWNLATVYLAGVNCLEPTKADLEKAKEHLRAHDFVGVTERFDEAMDLFCKVFDLPYDGWKRYERVVTKAADKSEIPDDVREYIRERSWMDAELYELAKQIMDEQIERYASVPTRRPTPLDSLMMRARVGDFWTHKAVDVVRRNVRRTKPVVMLRRHLVQRAR